MSDPRRDGADAWLDYFGYVLEPNAIRTLRQKPAYQAFTGSRWLAFPWLVVVGTLAGALGGVLVSGALWSVWWQVPLAFLGLAAFAAVILRATLAAYERPIASLSGWCIFFGLLIGAFTMWAAQVESSGWAYEIAGGAVFLLVGITGGDLPPPNGKGMEDWYLTSAFAAPAASCLAVYLYRSGFDVGGIPAGGISSAAVAGGLAGALFMSVLIGLYLLAWKPARGLLNLATLCLHSDETAPEAVKLFQRLLEVEQPTAELYARSGLAHALAGDAAAAEKDWAKAAELEPDGVEPAMSRGWSALRRRDPEAAAHSFLAALERRANEVMALVGLGLANLASANGAAALDALRRIPRKSHDALSLTYLAEAHLMACDAAAAFERASTVLGEFPAIHARPRVVRAEASLALGDVSSAAKDFEWTLLAKDELGIRERALAGLDEVRRQSGQGHPV